MAFDKTQPTDTTKIRNLGVVIRPNWVAMEEADSTFRPYALNLQNRTPLGVANDPAIIADTFILYEKDDGAANPELFGIDASSNIIQLTTAGSLGNTSTDLQLNSFTFDGTLTMNENNVISGWSYTQKNGTQSGSFGMTCSRISTAIYEYTFTQAMANTNYSIVAMAINTGGTGNVEIMQEQESFTRTTTKFRLVGVNQNNTVVSSGVIHNVMVVGGRA